MPVSGKTARRGAALSGDDKHKPKREKVAARCNV